MMMTTKKRHLMKNLHKYNKIKHKCTCNCWLCKMKSHCCADYNCEYSYTLCPACEALQDWCVVHREEHEIEEDDVDEMSELDNYMGIEDGILL